MTPQLKNTSLPNALGCTGRTPNLSGVCAEARKRKTLLQRVQNTLGGLCFGKQSFLLKVRSPHPRRGCPSADTKILVLGRELMDKERI